MLKRLISPSIFLIFVLVLCVSMLGVDEAQAAEVNPPDYFWSFSHHKSFTALWQDPDHAFAWFTQHYNFRYRKQGDTSWTELSNNIAQGGSHGGGKITIPDLKAGTTYEYQARTHAATLFVSKTSDWSATQTAKTNANGVPTTVGSIPDRSPVVEGSTITLGVSSYFSDPNNDPLTYTATSSDTNIATVSVSEANVSISTLVPGSVTISVTATDDSGDSATQTFTATVKAYAVPEPVGTIPDQTLKVGSNAVIHVSSSFSHGDGDTMTYSATSSDTSIATVSVLLGTPISTLTVMSVSAGSATITVTATDSRSATATQSFTVTLEANTPPVTVGTIPDQTVSGTGSAATVDLNSYFDDPDAPPQLINPLTYTVTSSDTSIAAVSLADSTLTITAVVAGSATITVTATDTASATATQTFSVTVVTNRAPVPVGTIPTQTLSVGGTAATVDMSPYFSDPDGNSLTYVARPADTSIVTVSRSGSNFTITPVAAGSTTITAQASDDSNASVTQTFTVNVVSNRTPTKVGSIPTQTVGVGGTAATVDVSSYFSDPDGNPLTYTATSSNPSRATVSLSDSTLTITAAAAGWSTITVNATDTSNAAATQTFSVNVVSNRSPTRVGTIPKQTVRVGGTAATIDVSGYFSDPDGHTLTYSATSSNTNKATVSLSDSTLTITAVAAGSATIRVKATDTYNASTTQSFSVTVLASNAVVSVGTISTQNVFISGTATTVDVSSYFSGPDGETLTYSATSSSTSRATVSVSGATITITGVAAGWSTIRVTATGTGNASATQSFSVRVYANRAPTAVGTIPSLNTAQTLDEQLNISSYFSDPDGNTLTYSASSSNDTVAEASMSSTDNSVLLVLANGLGTATITVTATDPGGLTATQTFSVEVGPQHADAVPGLSSTEQLLLGKLLTYDTIIFNELYNGSDDANDWLELRNVSLIDIPLDNWQLSIQTGSGTAVIPFPAWTVIPAGEVLLITNTKLTTSSVVVESFVLPETDFALILRSPTAFGDIAGNYFQTQKERPETAPELTTDTVWERVQATTSGYRAEAWAVSTHRNGLGSPGYHPSAVMGDLNHDGVVNILDLVLVASQFGTTGITAADLNGDGTVNIQDLVFVANAISNVHAAPTAKQSSAAMVNHWLQLARQNESVGRVERSETRHLPEGFSYDRGIQVLEQLARALTPDTTALLANYPNPFNPETWIPYQLSEAAEVTVTIYASDGSVVRTLALGHQAAGMYKNRTQAAYWDGKNELGETVASGLYFYTLTAGDFSATRKMLILK